MLCGEQTSLIDILIDSLMICFKWSHPRYTSCLALPRAAVIKWSKEHSLPTILIDVSVIFQEKMQRICGFQLLNVKIYSCFFVIQSLAFGLMTTWWALFKLFFFQIYFIERFIYWSWKNLQIILELNESSVEALAVTSSLYSLSDMDVFLINGVPT